MFIIILQTKSYAMCCIFCWWITFGCWCEWSCDILESGHKQSCFCNWGISEPHGNFCHSYFFWMELWEEPRLDLMIEFICCSWFVQSISALSFIPKSKNLVTVSKGSSPRLSVWNLSTLSIWWSYSISVEGSEPNTNCSSYSVLKSTSLCKCVLFYSF